ncbi:hypothetical protein ACFSTC_44155 [Nonomuraea ferruginea]
MAVGETDAVADAVADGLAAGLGGLRGRPGGQPGEAPPQLGQVGEVAVAIGGELAAVGDQRRVERDRPLLVGDEDAGQRLLGGVAYRLGVGRRAAAREQRHDGPARQQGSPGEVRLAHEQDLSLLRTAESIVRAGTPARGQARRVRGSR